MHELKLIVDLCYQGGLNYMRYSVSDTAEYGDYIAGSQVVNDSSRAAMRKLLAEIQDGTFARAWIDENKAGQPNFQRRRAQDIVHPIELVGRELRRMMPFVNPKEVIPGAGGA
jgi:ketol-acid reductoisomerase